ncbi:MAG: hypothetical protein KJ704_01355 [Proteobacteria bacterium]|nr:hypothetical protein [Pseudomonadota bacterium]
MVLETLRWLREESEPTPEPLGMKKFRGHITLLLAGKRRELAIRITEEGG